MNEYALYKMFIVCLSFNVFLLTVIHKNCFSCFRTKQESFWLGYFMWRVMTKRHECIEYMMQVPGHARCLVDSEFASVKKLYRRTDCDTFDQLEEIVNKSSTTNEAVRYPAWQWQDWKAFLEPVFHSLPRIRYAYISKQKRNHSQIILTLSIE